jgi:gliding motility-associated-like protein
MKFISLHRATRTFLPGTGILEIRRRLIILPQLRIHTMSYSLPGVYTITLEITTDNGCTETYTKTLSVTLPDNLFIPTGFTPNNDGNNDLFRVRGHNILFADMSIYNQWGQRIWYSPKEMTGWDGTANGQKVPMGSYAYVIEIHFDSGKKEIHRGNINLIR